MVYQHVLLVKKIKYDQKTNCTTENMTTLISETLWDNVITLIKQKISLHQESMTMSWYDHEMIIDSFRRPLTIVWEGFQSF